MAEFIDAAKWALARRQWTVDRDYAREAIWIIERGTDGHGAAGAMAGDEDSVRVDVEASLGGFDAIGDSRFGIFDHIAGLPPTMSAAAARVFPRTLRCNGDEVSHANLRHDLPQFVFVAGMAVEPNEQRVGVACFVMDRGERGERRGCLASGATVAERVQFMGVVG